MRFALKLPTAALALVLAGGPLWAHDTWLLPERFRTAAGTLLSFHLTSGMAFPKPETAVNAERLTEAKLRVAGGSVALEAGSATETLALTARPAGSGIVVAWVATRERALQLTPGEVGHYLEEIGADESIGRKWKKSGRKTWRETYVKRAKTFVRVGAGTDESWKEPVGLDLELVPESDPTALSAGDRLSLRLLSNGKPLSGLSVAAVGTAPSKAVMARTDGEGRVAFVLSQAGPWLIRATQIRPSRTWVGGWDSTFTTLTVEARSP